MSNLKKIVKNKRDNCITNRQSFSDEVRIMSDIMINSAHLIDASFVVMINGLRRELLLSKDETGNIIEAWRWENMMTNQEYVSRAGDEERYWRKMRQLEEDARLGRELRGIERHRELKREERHREF